MWNNVEEFAAWYKQNKYPIRPPFEDPIYVTEISYSYVLFREGQYQAELYLVRPHTGSPDHSHPGVNNIIMLMGGDIGLKTNGVVDMIPPEVNIFGIFGPTINSGDTHALHVGERGGEFLSLEKWDDGMKPTSVTIRWEGDTCGDSHTALVDIS
jgi:hypothetical protein